MEQSVALVASATFNITADGGDMATSNVSANQPDWNFVLPQSEVDFQTLLPTGPGDLTEIPNQYPNSGQHWDKVAETSPDDWSTYIYNQHPGGYSISRPNERRITAHRDNHGLALLPRLQDRAAYALSRRGRASGTVDAENDSGDIRVLLRRFKRSDNLVRRHAPARNARMRTAAVGDYVADAKDKRDLGLVLVHVDRVHFIKELADFMYDFSKLSTEERIKRKIEAQNIASTSDWEHMVQYYIQAHNMSLQKK